MAKSTRFYPPFRKLLLTPYFSNIFGLKLIWLLILTFTYHIQHHQEPPCPPRLQEETWRTGWALMRFLLTDIDEIFRKASLLYCLTSDTIKKVVRNLHVLQDSRKRFKGHGESWQGSRCLIVMKLSGKLPRGCPNPLTPFPMLSGTSMSSKTPGRDLKDMESLERVQDVWL